MASLADLVGGFEKGYKASSDRRRNRQVEKALDYELEDRFNRGQADKADLDKYNKAGGLAPTAEFTGQQPKTYGERLGGWIRGFFPGGGQAPSQAIPTAPAATAAPQMSPVDPQPSPFGRYADGGSVRHMRKYANGGRSIMPDRSSPAPSGTAMRDNRRSTASTALPVGFADGGAATAVESGAGRGATADMIARNRAAFEAGKKTGLLARGGAAASRVAGGAAAVPAFVEGAKNIGTIGGALAAGGDVTDDELGVTSTQEYRDRLGLPDSDRSLLGDLGTRTVGALGDLGDAITFGGATKLGEYLAGDDDPAKTQAIAAAVEGEQNTPPPPTPAQPNPAPAAAAPQAIAPQAVVPEAPTEENPWASITAMPEDMPTQSAKDWEKERAYAARQAVLRGQNPREAMEGIDQEQMEGFNRIGQQALQLLIQGNTPAAGRALKAAYQYFPNGVDVKFGIQTGKDGQKVLVGMGVDEETGEAIKGGKPQVITPESLSVQLENMSNPAAFRVWTKDRQKMEQEIREYEEVIKPTSDSNIQYRKDAGTAAINRSEADLIKASTTGQGGGLKQTDRDRANSAFVDAVAQQGFDDPAKADAMMDMMAQIYASEQGRTQYPTIIRDVKDAIRNGDFSKLDEKYGN